MHAEPARGPEVRIEALSLRLGGVAVLDGVDLRVAAGTLHCLVGPNGAGKTSLLRCLLGQAPHSGRVALAWAGAPGATGYVPQTLDVDRTLPVTAEDFLTLLVQRTPACFEPRGAVRATVAAALADAGLGAKGARPLGRLSGGELKRLLLAQALLPRPALLLLDEPMNHLDPAGVEQATGLLRGLRAAGTTIVCTLHDLGHVRALADGVTGLAGGRVVFSGEPAAVLTPANLLRAYAGANA